MTICGAFLVLVISTGSYCFIPNLEFPNISDQRSVPSDVSVWRKLSIRKCKSGEQCSHQQIENQQQLPAHHSKQLDGAITTKLKTDVTNVTSNVSVYKSLDISNRTNPNKSSILAFKENSGNSTDNDLIVGSLNLKVKISNKDEGKKDMWKVSNFLLSQGTKKSILEAIKKSVGVKDPAMLKGIERSMTKSFEKMRDEALHVDKPEEQTIDENGNRVSLLSFHV